MHQAGARSSRTVGVRRPLIMGSEQLRDFEPEYPAGSE